MKKTLVLLLGASLALVSSGNALAYNKFISDVNDSCGYEVIYDCDGCHVPNDNAAPTIEKDLYLSEGACGFCTENTSCNSAPPTEEELLAEGRRVTKDYFETLFTEFMSHLNDAKNNGIPGNPFAEVFPACPKIAPEIASDKSRMSGYLVRRVTERTRNSRNIPDDWELKHLRVFAAKAANGDTSRVLMEIPKPDGSGNLKSMEYEAFEIVTEGELKTKGKNRIVSEPRAYFRYMRSLSMPPMPFAFGGPEYIDPPANTKPNPNLPCLLCHGTTDQVADEVEQAITEFYPYDEAMGYKAGDIRGAWSVKIPLNEVPQ